MREAIKILLVENNQADEKMLRSFFKKTAFDAKFNVVASVSEGVKKIASQNLDLVLLSMDLLGSKANSELKKLVKACTKTPVIVLSAEKKSKSKQLQIIKKGVQDYLIKEELSHQLLEKAIRYSIERFDHQLRLKETNEKYDDLVNTMNEGLVQVDEKNNISFVNKRFCELLGYSKKEVKGQNIFDTYIYETDRKLVSKKIALRKKGISDTYELRLKTKKGDYLWAFISSSPIFNGNKEYKGSLSLISDLTQQKKLISTLVSEQEEKLKLIYNNAHVGIARVDYYTNKFLQVNKYVIQQLGYKEEELLELDFFEIIAKEDRERVLQVYNAFRDNTKNTAEAESKIITKDDKVLDIELSITLISPKNKPGYFVVVFKDITQLKKSERKLEENSQMLLDFNKELLDTIAKQQTAEEELRLKNRELDTFVYKASHDLKGPLASIKGLTQLASRELSDKSSLDYIEKISQSANRLDGILSDLISVSRASLSELKIERISTSQLVADIVQSLKYAEDAENVEIIVNIEHGDYRVDTSKELLHSILQNLVLNSIKYKDTDKERQYVKIKVEQVNQYIRFSVTDNGVGITDEYKEKVFDMFFRANETSSGSGLGLYIVKKSVEKLNGNITLEDNPEGGSIFKIDIPIK